MELDIKALARCALTVVGGFIPVVDLNNTRIRQQRSFQFIGVCNDAASAPQIP